MERKQLAVELKDMAVSDVGAGEITGLAAVYGNVDYQDDMFEAGAFAKSASDWSRAKAKLPLLDWHGDSLDRIIGSILQLKSVAQGLWFRAGFTKDERGQRARQLAKDGHLTGVSVGWLPIGAPQIREIGGKAVQVIREARVHEISLTAVPANPEAQLVSVKSLDGATIPGVDYVNFDAGLRAAMTISFEPARKAAVLELLAAYQTNQQAAGAADEPPTADDAAPTEDPSAEGTSTPPDNAAAYALRLITPPGPRDGAPDGKPPPALAYPQQLLQAASQQADLDRLEAEINHALGRAAG